MSFPKKHLVIGLLFVILESTLFMWISDPVWVPHLSLAFVIFISLEFGPGAGAMTGFVVGLVLELFGLGPFGLMLVVYLLSGLICGLCRAALFPESVLTQILIPGLVCGILVMVPFMISSFEDPTPKVLLVPVALRHSNILATAVAGPVVYYFLEKLKKPA